MSRYQPLPENLCLSGYVWHSQVTDIEGVTSIPAFMSQRLLSPPRAQPAPSVMACPADGNHPFNLYYTVLDSLPEPHQWRCRHHQCLVKCSCIRVPSSTTNRFILCCLCPTYFTTGRKPIPLLTVSRQIPSIRGPGANAVGSRS